MRKQREKPTALQRSVPTSLRTRAPQSLVRDGSRRIGRSGMYLNFDELPEFVDASDKVEISDEMREAAKNLSIL